MNKTELVINGIRARTFKVKYTKTHHYILNDLILLNFSSSKELPDISNKITIKPRHTKFKYSKNVTRTVLSIYRNRIYKIYFFKDNSWGWLEAEVTKCINAGGQF